MADEKDYEIHLKTTADTKGAKATESALKDTTEAAKKLTNETDDKSAGESLVSLRRKVYELRQELESAAIGSDKFKSAKERLISASTRLETAQKGLGGSTRNAGLATLEFSRALEDSQYGIRGVLNNIPGLVTMLGGGAGLAGVLSITAVLASQLFERLGALGESAEERAKKIDLIGSVFNNIAQGIQDIADKNVNQMFADMAAKTQSLKIDNDAVTQSYNNEIIAIDNVVNAVNRLKAASDERLRSEIELRKSIDPNFSEGDATKADIQIKQNAIQDEKKNVTISQRTNVDKIQQDSLSAQQGFAGYLQQIEDLKQQRDAARAELTRIEPNVLPAELRGQDARANIEKKMEDLKPWAITKMVFDMLGKFGDINNEASVATGQGKILPGSNDIDSKRKNEMSRLQAQIDQIDKAYNVNGADQQKNAELTAAVEKLDKTITDLETNQQVEQSKLEAILKNNAEKIDQVNNEAASAVQVLDQKTETLKNNSVKVTIKTSVDELGKEIGQLEASVADGTTGVKRSQETIKKQGEIVKKLKDEFEKDTKDGVVTEAEATAIKQKFDAVKQQVFSVNQATTTNLGEFEKSLTDLQNAIPEAIRRMGESQVKVVGKVVTVVDNQTAKYSEVGRRLDAIEARQAAQQQNVKAGR